jgi:hypothetical protein
MYSWQNFVCLGVSFFMEVKIQPKGPQTQAAARSADILIYGGGAGDGKSYLMVNEPLRHVGLPGIERLQPF